MWDKGTGGEIFKTFYMYKFLEEENNQQHTRGKGSADDSFEIRRTTPRDDGPRLRSGWTDTRGYGRGRTERVGFLPSSL